MPKLMDPWEATSWEELMKVVTLDEVKTLYWRKERQRQRDQVHNQDKRAIVAYARENPELFQKALKHKK